MDQVELVEIAHRAELKKLSATLADCQSRLAHVRTQYLNTRENTLDGHHGDSFDINGGLDLLDMAYGLPPDIIQKFTCPGCQERDRYIRAGLVLENKLNEKIAEKDGRLDRAREAWGVLGYVGKKEAKGRYIAWHEAVDAMTEALAENEEG